MASAVVQGVGAVLLLCGSNTFMTTAWYLHLKFHNWRLVKAILISWLIALFEYTLQVPANRMGHFSHGGPFTAAQLKIIQEFISLTAFAIFSVLVLKERLRWVDLGAFVLIMGGVAVGMVGKPPEKQAAPPPPPALVPPPQQGPPPLQELGRKLLQLHLLPVHPVNSSTIGGSGKSEGQGSAVQAAGSMLNARPDPGTASGQLASRTDAPAPADGLHRVAQDSQQPVKLLHTATDQTVSAQRAGTSAVNPTLQAAMAA